MGNWFKWRAVDEEGNTLDEVRASSGVSAQSQVQSKIDHNPIALVNIKEDWEKTGRRVVMVDGELEYADEE